MSGTFWKRHSNPLSGWSRFAAYPVLVLTMYTQQWAWMMVVILFFAINPVLFKEPKTKDAWMTKVVLGEQIWMNTGRQNGFLLSLNVVNSLLFLGLIWAALTQRFWITVFSTVLTAALKLWFCHHMVLLYERTQRQGLS